MTWTVADYLQWQGDWELWRGTAVAMTPSPFGRHQYVAANILARLHRQLKVHGGRCRILPGTDWHVSHDTVVRPDLAIVCDGIPEKFLDSPPALIVEVLSPSTEAKDRSAKSALYEEHQVSYYVLADPGQRTIEAYHWRDGHYVPWTEAAFELPDGCCVSLDAELEASPDWYAERSLRDAHDDCVASDIALASIRYDGTEHACYFLTSASFNVTLFCLAL